MYSKKAIEIINKETSSFFYLYHEVLLNDIIMTICRLSDKESTFGKENVSILNIRKYFNKDTEICNMVDIIFDDASKIKKYRNHYLGHNDLESIKNGTNEKIEIPEIDKFVNNTGNLIKHIYLKYLKIDLALEIIPPLSNSRALLMRLQDGLKYKNEIMERLVKREITGTWDDYIGKIED
jgi:hypothetical protein